MKFRAASCPLLASRYFPPAVAKVWRFSPVSTRKLSGLTLLESYNQLRVDFVYNLLTKVYNAKSPLFRQFYHPQPTFMEKT